MKNVQILGAFMIGTGIGVRVSELVRTGREWLDLFSRSTDLLMLDVTIWTYVFCGLLLFGVAVLQDRTDVAGVGGSDG